ncbi:MAG: AMP-binding protein [Deltaproteobacteria bacterium]|nr:AMP-binding protein [Deltaproteobacteria bacterium]
MVTGDMVTNNARRIPDREALIWGDERLTWAKLNQRVNCLSNGLISMGIQPGDRVAFLLNNCKEIVELYYAIAKIGAVSAPIMPRSVGREIAYIVNNVEAKALITSLEYSSLVNEVRDEMQSLDFIVGLGGDKPFDVEYEDLLGRSKEDEPSVQVSPDSIYAIIHTSGTTGFPKGCIAKHGPKMISRLSSLVNIPHREDDRAMIFTPLTAGLGSDMLHNHILKGIPTVLLPKFDQNLVLESIEKERISLTYIIESTFDRLIKNSDLENYDLSSLRYIHATSATRDAREGIQRLRKLKSFRGQFYNCYGSTEAGGWITFCSPTEIERGLDDPKYKDIFKSIGQEAILCRIDCIDDDGNTVPTGEIGEMVVRSPWLFAGYWNQPEQTAEVLRDRRMFTGDLARKDEKGFIYLEGRKKDMIKSGGINVYPAEVEEILRGYGKIAEVAVVGVPDKHWGEKVVACVVTKSPCTEQELLDYSAKKLAGYKKPKIVVFLDELPKNITGKILKKRLRDELIASESPSL